MVGIAVGDVASGAIGSGAFALAGTAQASSLNTVPFPLPGGPPMTGLAAIVHGPEDARLGGSMNVKWVDAGIQYRIVARLSVGVTPPALPVDYWGAFFHEDNYIFCVVHYEGYLVSGNTKSVASGDGWLFALGHVDTPGGTASIIEVWLPQLPHLVFIWSDIVVPVPPIPPGYVPAAAALRTSVGLD